MRSGEGSPALHPAGPGWGGGGDASGEEEAPDQKGHSPPALTEWLPWPSRVWEAVVREGRVLAGWMAGLASLSQRSGPGRPPWCAGQRVDGGGKSGACSCPRQCVLQLLP